MGVGKRATARKFGAAAVVLSLAGAFGAQQASNGAMSSGGSTAASVMAAARADFEAHAKSQVPEDVRTGAARAVGSVPAQQPLRLALGLTHPDSAGEQRLNAQLEDKSSPRFHHWLTAAQWNARFAPSLSTEQAVVDWAKRAGLTVTHRYANRLIVDVQGNAATIERAFGVQLRDYRTKDGTFYSNDAEPKLPASISPYVHSVDGLNDIQQMRTMADAVQPASPRFVAGPAVAQGPTIQRDATAKAPAPQPDLTNGYYDPQDIYSSGAYDYAALQRQGHCCNPTHVSTGSPAQTSIAIATFGTQAPSDFTGFHNAFPYLAQNITEYYIDGTPTTSDFEGTMDAEWSLATSNSFGSYLDTAHVYLYDGANTNNATYTDIYNQMLNDNRARVFSTSWSCTEWTGCTSDTMETRSGIFSSMVAQGWTLVTASGDRGAYDDCHDVMVSYPASDPNVLGVGGTWLQLNSSDQWLAETAWQSNPQGCANNGGGSGGGCSFQFARPSYDLQQLCGRARSVPDVSLNADWYNEPQNYYYNGALRLNGGTSIAAPEMAGFFAQENAYRASFGSGPLGVANYPVWDAAQYTGTHRPFYDITFGCNGNDIGQGYCAGPGYDLVTGWGSADMLMLAWEINYFSTPDDGRPVVSLSGPPTSTWIRTNTPITWTVADTGGGAAATGVAGYSSAWDQTIADPYSEAHGGSGNVFFDGPQVPNGTSGSAYPASAGQGCNTLHVDAWDNMGFSSTDQTYGPVCYDSVAPTITVAPKSVMTVGAKVTATGVPVTTSWAATDTTSGVKSYTLQRKTDTGAFTNVTLGSPTATSITQTLAPGHTYAYQVRATDNAGNTSAFTPSGAFTVNLVQENAAGVGYSAGWTRQALSGASGGFVDFSSASGKTVTISVKAKEFAWVSTKATNRGVASVKFDATAPVNVDTKGTATNPSTIVFSKAYAFGLHKFVITNSGTAGRQRVDVDAFVYFS